MVILLTLWSLFTTMLAQPKAGWFHFTWCELANNHTKVDGKISKCLFLCRGKEVCLGAKVSKQGLSVSPHNSFFIRLRDCISGFDWPNTFTSPHTLTFGGQIFLVPKGSNYVTFFFLGTSNSLLLCHRQCLSF